MSHLLEREVPNILLSIEPAWAEAIIDGSKAWEYRRVAPAKDPPYRVVLYATAPEKAAVGVAKVNQVLEGPVPPLADQTLASTPHSLEDLLGYFEGVNDGHALRIESAYSYDEPVSRTELESAGLTPSQNFRYIGTVSADFDQVEAGFLEVADAGEVAGE